MGSTHGSDITLIRHVLTPDECAATRDAVARSDKGLSGLGRRPVPISGPGLGAAVGDLIALLGRPETGALFVLDGAEHLGVRHISALRRRSGHPNRDPKLAKGALEDPLPDTGRRGDGSVHDEPVRRNIRLAVSSVARHLVEIKGRGPGRIDRSDPVHPPRLSSFLLPVGERDEACRLAQDLLKVRFGTGDRQGAGTMPRAMLLALLDLVTILARGSRAYVLTLDHDHLDDAADPRALDKYSVPALSLEAISARTQYKRRVKAEKAKRVRMLEDPQAKRDRIKATHLMGVKGGIKGPAAPDADVPARAPRGRKTTS